MLTTEPTSEMIAEWKRIFEAHHSTLTPNRKLGHEVDQYFREKYIYKIFNNAEFQEIAMRNICIQALCQGEHCCNCVY